MVNNAVQWNSGAALKLGSSGGPNYQLVGHFWLFSYLPEGTPIRWKPPPRMVGYMTVFRLRPFRSR